MLYFLKFFLFLFFLFLPEFVFNISQDLYPVILSRHNLGHYVFIILLGLSLFLARPRWLVVLLLGVFFIGQMIWIVSLMYFGEALTPSQVVLFFDPSTSAVDDVAVELKRIISQSWWMILVLATSFAACIVALLGKARINPRVSGTALVLLLLMVVAYPARVVLFKGSVAVFPTATMPPMVGYINTFALAAKQAFSTPRSVEDTEKYSFSAKLVADLKEPVTIVFLMGESVNPSRMSVFDPSLETTPLIRAMDEKPDAGFKLLGTSGLSAAVSTVGSTTLNMRLAYYPGGADYRLGNIFEVAEQAGFRSYYFSAQGSSYLDIAGGRNKIARVETRETQIKAVAERQDDLTVELIQATKDDAKKRFFFIHQRVNHTEYFDNCPQLPANAFPELTYAKPTPQPLKDYDKGMQCYDRHVRLIADAAKAFPGKVYVFMTSDHGEMVGEGKRWGHGFADPRVALVPMLLYTNDPEGAAAQALRKLQAPSAYEFQQVVLRAMSVDLTTPAYDPKIVYINDAVIFGRGGYLRAERETPFEFAINQFDGARQFIRKRKLVFPDLLRRRLGGDAPAPNG